jgi:hypothetical protein
MPTAKPTMVSVELKSPAEAAESQVRVWLLKGISSLQEQKESLTLLLAFQIWEQSTWQE